MLYTFTERRKSQRGFSLVEIMFATVILLVGLVAIAQLVPASILLNNRNRMDSSALVLAQRELDFMIDQPLTLPSFTDPFGVYCPIGNTCNLGNPAPPNQVQGSPVVAVNNQPLINFGNPVGVANWSFTYQDPNDPSGATYDVRWAVIVTANNGTPSAKRFILGVQQVSGNGYFQPITLDTMVSK